MATQNSVGSFASVFPSVAAVPAAGAGWMAEADRKWNEARARFMAAVAADLRPAVDARLDQANAGGGLHAWLNAIAWRGAVLPRRLPRELVQAYLDDPE